MYLKKTKKLNRNNTHERAADEAAVTEAADDAEAASSCFLRLWRQLTSVVFVRGNLRNVCLIFPTSSSASFEFEIASF